MSDSATKFVEHYIRRKSVDLSGLDWEMVMSTMQESADNCFRCKNSGCPVCRDTRAILERINQQLK